MRILVVEDEERVVALLQRALEREGHEIDVATTGADALEMATNTDYDVIVLDVVIPAPDGLEVCRVLRQRGRWVPILLLTARGSIEDRVNGLDAGADDYLAKPFSVSELRARVRALSRRSPRERTTPLEVGDLQLDPAERVVTRAGAVVPLSPREFALLELLMRRPDEVLTRQEILEGVWEGAQESASNVVDVYVRYLREKLDRPFGRNTIETVRGAGYRLRSSDGRTPGGDGATADPR
jgi:two-component system, OmpR family, response regulator